MSDYVTIANMAAARIGTETRIASPTDDRFVARTIAAAWDIQRQAAIRDGAWNFAGRRFEAAAVFDPDRVVYPWTNFFRMPSLNLRLIEVFDLEPSEYEYEDSGILSNSAGPLRGRHLIDVLDPAQWDPGFAESFALRLAFRCGRRIAGSSFDQDQCWAEYRQSLSAARRVDARENPRIEQEESSWVTARFGGRSGYGGV